MLAEARAVGNPRSRWPPSAIVELVSAFLRLLGIILLTAFGLVLFTQYEGSSLNSVSRVLGYPVVSIAQSGARGVLAVGQVNAVGVLVISQLGAGVVAFTQGGAGLVFALCQLGFSLVVIGQLGIGVFWFLGQVGVGSTALGQAVYRRRTKEELAELNAELTEVLRFRR